jgi:hypothetical protein
MPSLSLIAARDISIIILAVSSIIVMALLSVLIIQTVRLSRMLRDEVLPMLQATQETLGTMRGTATFMGDHMVQPVVKASSYAYGMRSALRTLLSGQPSGGRK